METLVIRNLDNAVLVRLKRTAWQQGLTVEETLRRILSSRDWPDGSKPSADGRCTSEGSTPS